MKLWKKIMLSIGTIATVAAPVSAVVSCGSTTNNKTTNNKTEYTVVDENEKLNFEFSRGLVYNNDPVEASLIKIESFIEQVGDKKVYLAKDDGAQVIDKKDLLEFLKKWSFSRQEDFSEKSEEFLNIWNLGILNDKSKTLGSIIKIFFDEVNAPELKSLIKDSEDKGRIFVVNFYKGNFIFTEKHFIETGMVFDDRQNNIDYLNKIINGVWKKLDVKNYKK